MVIICVSVCAGLALAAYTDGSGVAEDPRDTIFDSSKKTSYESQLGLVPNNNPLDLMEEGSSNYEIEQSIIDMKREKKKIVANMKVQKETEIEFTKDVSSEFQERLRVVREQAAAQKIQESIRKKLMIVQILFFVVCVGTVWFIRDRTLAN